MRPWGRMTDKARERHRQREEGQRGERRRILGEGGGVDAASKFSRVSAEKFGRGSEGLVQVGEGRGRGMGRRNINREKG